MLVAAHQRPITGRAENVMTISEKRGVCERERGGEVDLICWPSLKKDEKVCVGSGRMDE